MIPPLTTNRKHVQNTHTSSGGCNRKARLVFGSSLLWGLIPHPTKLHLRPTLDLSKYSVPVYTEYGDRNSSRPTKFPIKCFIIAISMFCGYEESKLIYFVKCPTWKLLQLRVKRELGVTIHCSPILQTHQQHHCLLITNNSLLTSRQIYFSEPRHFTWHFLLSDAAIKAEKLFNQSFNKHWWEQSPWGHLNSLISSFFPLLGGVMCIRWA